MLTNDEILMKFLEINYLELQSYIQRVIGLDPSYFEAYLVKGRMHFRFRESAKGVLKIRFEQIRQQIYKDYQVKWTS